MFVRTLIGREAGTIIDLPYSAAQSCLAAGTAQKVTDEEIREAGLTPPPSSPVNVPEGLPRGYRIEPDPDGPGFNVIDPGGVTLTAQPLPNLAAARSLAHQHADPLAGGLQDQVELSSLTRAELEALAAEKGIDTSGAKKKADVIAAIEPVVQE